ncbi:hypothetical protein BSKO_00317 [Bryopsis sp. KO-2023]|nr:hypothetical protein BSKO_00317 [Bryopsis sp. KO-2023]
MTQPSTTPGGAVEGSIKRVPLFRVGTQESFDSPIDRRSDYYRRQARYEHQPLKPRPQPLLTIPTILTLLRVALVPFLVGLWFTKFDWASSLCTTVFVVASLTDWLDGYLARKLQLATEFGAFLDPVADKLMVATTLVLLTTSPPEPLTNQAMVIPVVIIIGREITMSALREWAASAGSAVHTAVKVNSLGKWKTVFQFSSTALLLFCRQPTFFLRWMEADMETGLEKIHVLTHVAWGLLWFAAFLAILSLSRYMSNVWAHFKYPVKKSV